MKIIKDTYNKTKSWFTVAAGTATAAAPWALIGLENPPEWTPGAVMAGMAIGLGIAFKGVDIERGKEKK